MPGSLTERKSKERIPLLEEAAETMFRAKRDFELDEAKKYLATEGSIPERKAKTIEAMVLDAASTWEPTSICIQPAAPVWKP